MPKQKKSTPTKLTPNKIERLKQEAKQYKKKTGCTHAEALDHVAREYGFGNWKSIQKIADKSRKLDPPTPKPSLNFIAQEDFLFSENEIEQIRKNERLAEPDEAEKLLLVENRIYLAKKGIEYSIFEPTQTGLKKSILDATQPVRTLFKLVNFHNFSTQEQGTDNKIIKEAFFVTPQSIDKTKVSLYRPITKQGDPRMWFTKLGTFAKAGDQIAIIILDNRAYLHNLSKYNLNEGVLKNDLIGQFISQYCDTASKVSTELLEKLRVLAKNPLPAIGTGDTTIGMSIEAALNIQANSSKNPDYKGIEIKSGRGGKNRTTLFAQVADWTLSPCKSSKAILEKYGYERGEDFKLYCTISTQKTNSQGLSFKYNSKSDELNEYHSSGAHVATWTGEMLRSRLHEKHSETFWINASSEIIDGTEYFQLKSVIHTKTPLLNQLMPLIESGVITMDHLIKRKGGSRPKVSEKGPLFKIDKKNLSLLFPDPIKYSLK